VAAPPTIYEEIIAMNVFGSSYVLVDDSQLWLSADWVGWPEVGVTLVSDMWDTNTGVWRTVYTIWTLNDRGAYGPVTNTGLRRLQQCVPSAWVEVLKQGREPPVMGEWVVLRPSAMLHQGGALDASTQIGNVLGRSSMRTQTTAGKGPYGWSSTSMTNLAGVSNPQPALGRCRYRGATPTGP
jgi:hypothetical protein